VRRSSTSSALGAGANGGTAQEREAHQPQQHQKRDPSTHAVALSPAPTGQAEPCTTTTTSSNSSSSSSSSSSSAHDISGPSHTSSGTGTSCGTSSGSNSLAACYGGCGLLGWNPNFEEVFTMGREVGRGSFGIVRVATHKATGREYAVKVLPKCPPTAAATAAPTSSGSATTSGGGSGSSGGSGGACAVGPPPLTLTSSYSQTGAGASQGSQQPGQQLEAIEREVSAWMAVQVGRGGSEEDCRVWRD
jgi:hypothetical protein